MRCLVLGHLVKDVIINKGTRVQRIGGGAYYSALALSKYCKVRIATSVGEDFPSEWLKELENLGIDVLVTPSKESTSYELRYLDSDRRVLKLISRAAKLKIPHNHYDLIIVNPVAGEVGAEELKHLLKSSRFVAIDLQGFVRSTEPGVVKPKEVDASIFKGAKIIHGDSKEISLLRGFSPEEFEVALITKGSKGGLAFIRGKAYEFTPPRADIDDSTGAGDVFLASFAWFYSQCPFVQALKRAAAFTALFLKNRSVDFSMDEVNELAMKVEVKRV